LNPAQSNARAAGPLATAFLHHVQQAVDAWLLAALELAVEQLDAPTKRQRLDADCAQSAVVLQLLRQRRGEIVRHLGAALRERVAQHAAELGLAAPPDAAAPAAVGRAPASRLTLISEAQIDDEIETARIVQLLELGCEAELQELAALCSGLLERPAVEPATVPLRPAECARALREGVGRVTPDGAQRPALLRALGQAVGLQMRQVYAGQVEWLQRRGVQPASFRIRPTPGAAPGGPAAATATARLAMLAVEGLVGGPPPARPEASMRELVQWARRTPPAPLEGLAGAGEAPADDADGGLGELRLFDQPLSPAALPPEGLLPRAAAEELMRGLFGELRRQADTAPSMGPFLQRVERAAQRVAVADPALWSNPEHPWWQLLDRLLASGAVHDDLSPPDQHVLRRSLDAVVERVERSPRIDGPACMAAADELQSLASRLLESAAEPPADDVDEMQRLADREELEATFRQQIVQQLRSTPTSGAMRRFLVGPWTLVLVALAQRHGAEGAEVAEAALVVDDLIRATATPGQRVSKAQRNVLLRQVSDGLARAALPAPRIDAELVELADILRNPPPHPHDAQEAWHEEPLPPLPLPVTLDLHAGLPTVPLELPPGQGDTSGRITPADWLATLQAGVLCRLFLQGQWMTTRLHWVGPGQRLFLFQSRHGGRSHSLTQRMLQKLREAGLATSIDDDLMRAQAMESLVRHTVV
jgi:Protein of unknown function (DUF1631)